MGGLNILITFTIALAGALVFGYIAFRLKLSPIIGYILAGVGVGLLSPLIFISVDDAL
jgi:monovalent cation:H+ antiporter-2, CPA2 family